MTWDEKALDRLRKLWADGLSTIEIGRRLGCTKNAVIGKAHRIGLPGRPSPIATFTTGPNRFSSDAARAAKAKAQKAVEARRAESIARAAEMAQAGATSAEIALLLEVHINTALGFLRAAGMGRADGRRIKQSQRAASPGDTPRAPHAALRYGTTGCRFPFGEPRTADFRFCEAAEVVPGRPYCAACCARAYAPAQVSGLAMMPRRWVA